MADPLKAGAKAQVQEAEVALSCPLPYELPINRYQIDSARVHSPCGQLNLTV